MFFQVTKASGAKIGKHATMQANPRSLGHRQIQKMEWENRGPGGREGYLCIMIGSLDVVLWAVGHCQKAFSKHACDSGMFRMLSLAIG